MKAYLVRVAIDQAFGGWNAPVHPATGDFVYVPIPEAAGTRLRRGMQTPYASVISSLERFDETHQCTHAAQFPQELSSRQMHLDPDFGQLTYGDNGLRRGRAFNQLESGDILAFYAGLRPIVACEHRLIYAIIGWYVVQEVLTAGATKGPLRRINAHTRKAKPPAAPTDVIVRAQPGISGRLRHCIPIASYRDRAYRVDHDLLAAWGGLSANDGYIQRSAVPPAVLNAKAFAQWFDDQQPELLDVNNPTDTWSPVIIVLLRRPKSDPGEMRSDPFFEFGCFGRTGCHSKNLLHPKRAANLAGTRLAFAQGGPDGWRLVHVTSPITTLDRGGRWEARWERHEMPLRYDQAPILVDGAGQSDIPELLPLIQDVDRNTWPARFASAFRSRTKRLIKTVSDALWQAYADRRQQIWPEGIAEHYWESLPHPPPLCDPHRRRTFGKIDPLVSPPVPGPTSQCNQKSPCG